MNWTVIAKTGFLTSLIAYATLWGADLLRPGFVARYLSVHVFLLAAIVFGIWWLGMLDGWKDRPVIQWLAAAGFGFIAAVITWKTGEGLAEYRILVAGLSAVAPALVLNLMRYD